MLGYADTEIHADLESWFSRIHPGDRDRVKAEIIDRKKGTEPIFASEYRIRQKEGGYIWVLCRGIVVRDPAGRIVRMAGSQSDITQGKIVDPLASDTLAARKENCAPLNGSTRHGTRVVNLAQPPPCILNSSSPPLG